MSGTCGGNFTGRFFALWCGGIYPVGRAMPVLRAEKTRRSGLAGQPGVSAAGYFLAPLAAAMGATAGAMGTSFLAVAAASLALAAGRASGAFLAGAPL